MEAKYNYKELQFKCGLEIHQRLATENKLFCMCTTKLDEENSIEKIKREQRAVAGELGKIDRSTSFESKKQRYFIYELFKESSCLVDCDEEPPHNANIDAIKIAMTICSSFNTEIPDEIEVMRKGVVDGSDPSAFQRTMLIGYNGYVDVENKKIPITSIFLEEESSGIIKNTEEYVEYGLDRLAIPLIEIDTDPVIETPQEAKKIAMKIGLLLRLTGNAQRGIGSIRQDVNISIKNGARVEIKGFQELDSMDEIINAEITRQIKLLEIISELTERKAEISSSIEVTRIFSKTNSKLISAQIKNGGVVLAAKLSGFCGIIGKEIGNDIRLGTEISDYAKSAGVKGIIHSDEDMNKYEISNDELNELKRVLDIKKNDAFIIIAEHKEKAEYAMQLAIERAKLAMKEIPSETRAADSKKISTRFLRPIPGKSRMYPETDVLPINKKIILDEFKPEKIDVEQIKKQLDYEIGNKQLSEQILWSKDLQLYRTVIEKTGVAPAFAASVILEKFKELKRNGIDIQTVNEELIVYIFQLYADEIITKTAVGELFAETPKSIDQIKSILKAKKLERIKGKELERILEKYKGVDKGSILREVMTKYRMNIDGEELNVYIDALKR